MTVALNTLSSKVLATPRVETLAVTTVSGITGQMDLLLTSSDAYNRLINGGYSCGNSILSDSFLLTIRGSVGVFDLYTPLTSATIKQLHWAVVNIGHLYLSPDDPCKRPKNLRCIRLDLWDRHRLGKTLLELMMSERIVA